MRLRLTIFLIFPLLVAFSSGCSSQTALFEFSWNDPNPFDVEAVIYEVKEPPDTFQVLKIITSEPVLSDSGANSWAGHLTVDDAVHYYRMKLVRFDSIYSSFSETASAFLPLKPQSASNFSIFFHNSGSK